MLARREVGGGGDKQRWVSVLGPVAVAQRLEITDENVCVTVTMAN